VISNEKTCNAREYFIVEYDGYGNRGCPSFSRKQACKARKIIMDFREVSRSVCMLGFLIAAGPARDRKAVNCRLALDVLIICYQKFNRPILKSIVYLPILCEEDVV
jgi:hypothetical protein